MIARGVRNALVVALACLALPARAEPQECAGVPVSVEAGERQDFAMICEAARAAFAFLAGQGFTVDGHVAVIVQAEPAAHWGAASLGSYDRPKGETRVVSFRKSREMAEAKLPFGVAMTEALYRSFIAHEIAHALAAANFTVARPTLAAHEYVAYVTQLATLDPPLREEIIARSGLTGFDRADQIKDTYYLISPESFAINAYLHYLRPGNGAAFLREVLDGALSRSSISR